MSLIRAHSAILVVFACCGLAQAQIDHRTNRGNAETGARALDRNPNIGSGGFNLTRPGFDSGLRSDAIITGNVTGLGGFRGFLPIPQVGAFRGVLQSTTLSGFNARGVGLRDVVANQVPGTTYFYDPNRTIANLGQITNKQNAPGSSQLKSTDLSPTISHQPIPKGRDAADTRLGIETPPAKFGFSQTQIGTRMQPKPVDSIAPSYRAASESAIFGTTMPQVRPPFANQRSDVAMPEPDPGNERAGPGDLPETSTPAAEPAKSFETRRLNVLAVPSDEPAQVIQQARIGAQKPSPAEPMPLDGRAPSNLGADRFADLYSAVRAAEQMGVRDLANRRPGDRSAAVPGLVEADSEEAEQARVGRQDESIRQLATAAKWASEVLEKPVDTFVGRHANRLNQYLAEGEEALREKQYYRAAGLFELAHLIDPLNPLPLLHRGHALLAAGDYISALGSLTKGIDRFPHIAAFRMDLPKMVGNADIFDVRRADLEKQLADKDSYELRFLLGYMEYYSGLTDVGIENLKRAKALAPTGSTVAEFVRLLSGEKALPELPRG